MTTQRFALTLATGLLTPVLAAAVPLPKTMQAMAMDHPGGAEVVTLHTLAVPKPAADEVLIALHAAGVASWDVSSRQDPSGLKHYAVPFVLGTDGAGVIVAKGAKVKGFKIGDEVYSYSWDNPQGGFYAQYVAVPAERVGHVPKGLTLKQAGAAGTTALTAIQGIDDRCMWARARASSSTGPPAGSNARRAVRKIARGTRARHRLGRGRSGRGAGTRGGCRGRWQAR